MSVLPSNIRAVFFDLDDTLCGYWDASKLGMRRAFEQHGPPGFTPDEMISNWAATFREFSKGLKQTGWYPTYLKNGEPTRTEQMRLTLERIGINDSDLARKIGDTYAFERNANLKLFDDALDVLNALHPTHTMGLITNGPADIQRQEIETLGIEPYFPYVYIEGEMGIGKPRPEVFIRALVESGTGADEVVMVGNSYAHDILPAIEMGWATVWIRRDSDVPPSANGQTIKPESKPEGAPDPTATVGSLTEFLSLLKG
ncbi:MAG: HAD family hydrolase [Fimbriimonadaceae bacterium]